MSDQPTAHTADRTDVLRCQLADCYSAQNEPEKSIGVCATVKNRSLCRLDASYAKAYLRKGDFDSSIAHGKRYFERIEHELEWRDSVAIDTLIRAEMAKGDWPAAKYYADHYKSMFGSPPPTNILRIFVVRAGDLALGRRHCNSLIHLSKAQPETNVFEFRNTDLRLFAALAAEAGQTDESNRLEKAASEAERLGKLAY